MSASLAADKCNPLHLSDLWHQPVWHGRDAVAGRPAAASDLYVKDCGKDRGRWRNRNAGCLREMPQAVEHGWPHRHPVSARRALSDDHASGLLSSGRRMPRLPPYGKPFYMIDRLLALPVLCRH